MSRNVARTPRVAIIGAGLGGLGAALALRRRGVDVTVYERASQLGEVGAGIQLGPNAVRVLRALGVFETLQPLTAEPVNQVSVAWDDARLRYREPMKGAMLAKFGAPYVMAHRADLHRVLGDALPSGCIRLDVRCTSVSARNGVAVARCHERFGGRGGCDRWRRRHQLGGARDTVWPAAGPLHRADGMAVHGADRTPMPTQVGIARDRNMPHGWIGPNGHVICYPIRGGRLYNIFAGHVTSEWVEESWAVPSSINELLDGYRGWHPALLEMLSQVTDCYKWGIRDRDPLPRWTEGPITLLGDAAHPMMPTLAQGACMALEDGYVLGRSIGQHADAPEQGLAAYEDARRPRASRVVLQARQQFTNNRMNPPPPPLSRDWIFAEDVTREPVVA